MASEEVGRATEAVDWENLSQGAGRVAEAAGKPGRNRGSILP